MRMNQKKYAFLTGIFCLHYAYVFKRRCKTKPTNPFNAVENEQKCLAVILAPAYYGRLLIEAAAFCRYGG